MPRQAPYMPTDSLVRLNAIRKSRRPLITTADKRAAARTAAAARRAASTGAGNRVMKVQASRETTTTTETTRATRVTRSATAAAGGRTRAKGGSSHPTQPLPKLPVGVKRYSKKAPFEFNRKDQLLVGMTAEEFKEWVEVKKGREHEIRAAIEADYDLDEPKNKKKWKPKQNLALPRLKREGPSTWGADITVFDGAVFLQDSYPRDVMERN